MAFAVTKAYILEYPEADFSPLYTEPAAKEFVDARQSLLSCADDWRHAQVLLALPPPHALHRARHDAFPEQPGRPEIAGLPALAGTRTLSVCSPVLAPSWLTCKQDPLPMHAAYRVLKLS